MGIPPMVFLAEWMCAQQGGPWKPLVLMGSEIPFPFKARPSTILVPGIPAGSIAAMPLLDGWGVPSRLASKAGFPGCYDGFVTQLADEWLGSLDAAAKAEVEVFSCGPTPMLEAMAKVAAKHGVRLPGVARRIHGLRRRRLRRLHGEGEHARRAGDEARVRRRAGVRLARGVQLDRHFSPAHGVMKIQHCAGFMRSHPCYLYD